MDKHTDVQGETIILCHYCVAGYKNMKLCTSDALLRGIDKFLNGRQLSKLLCFLS